MGRPSGPALSEQIEAESEPQQLTDTGLAGPADEFQAGGQPTRVQLDPLAAEPDHRRLELRKLSELIGGQHLTAHGEVVAERSYRVEPDHLAADGHLPRLGRR